MNDRSSVKPVGLLGKVTPGARRLDKVLLNAWVSRFFRLLVALGCSGSVVVGLVRSHERTPPANSA
jgi:hypothetical protein